MKKGKSPLDRIVFRRDEKGELIEREISLDNGDKVFLVPLMIGEILRISLYSEDDIINYILINKVKNPVFTKEDIKLITPEYIKLFIEKIYEISDVKTDKKKKDDDEDDFGRRLREMRNNKIEFDSKFFLHGLGYTLFDMHKLTYAEINELVDAHNRDVEKKNNANKGKK